MGSSLIIGESTYRGLIGNAAVDNHVANTWIVRVDGVSGDDLKVLRTSVEADARIESALDWETSHEEVERNGGLIFGTPGLLSLQFVVASIAAIASSFVFLSLVLNQRQKNWLYCKRLEPVQIKSFGLCCLKFCQLSSSQCSWV